MFGNGSRSSGGVPNGEQQGLIISNTAVEKEPQRSNQ